MFKNPQVRVITRYSGVRRLALGKINTCFHIKQKLLGRSSGNTAAAALELVWPDIARDININIKREGGTIFTDLQTPPAGGSGH